LNTELNNMKRWVEVPSIPPLSGQTIPRTIYSNKRLLHQKS